MTKTFVAQNGEVKGTQKVEAVGFKSMSTVAVFLRKQPHYIKTLVDNKFEKYLFSRTNEATNKVKSYDNIEKICVSQITKG